MEKTPKVLTDAEVRAVREPIARASTLPPKCYVSREWYEKEVDAIFFREWVCVGRADQVPNSGDFFTLDVVGEPIVVNRNSKGEVRAHINSCRHRGTTVAQGKGNCTVFRCPYHSWIYSLDGDLVRTPGRHRPMDDVENFSKSDYGLVPVRLESWGGFLFINFDPNAAPLLTWLGDLPNKLKNYKLEEMVCTRQIEFEVHSNWKLPIENFLEPYHIETVHGKHLNSNYPIEFTFQESEGPYQATYGLNALSQLSTFPTIKGLDSKEREGVFHYWLVPNVKLTVGRTYMKFFLFFPQGPDKHRLVCCWCFPQSTVEREDFEATVGPAYYARGTTGQRDGDWVDEIIGEDNAVLDRCQQGLRSRFARSGRFSTSEALVQNVANYILDKVLGPDNDRVADGE